MSTDTWPTDEDIAAMGDLSWLDEIYERLDPSRPVTDMPMMGEPLTLEALSEAVAKLEVLRPKPPIQFSPLRRSLIELPSVMDDKWFDVGLSVMNRCAAAVYRPVPFGLIVNIEVSPQELRAELLARAKTRQLLLARYHRVARRWKRHSRSPKILRQISAALQLYAQHERRPL